MYAIHYLNIKYLNIYNNRINSGIAIVAVTSQIVTLLQQMLSFKSLKFQMAVQKIRLISGLAKFA